MIITVTWQRNAGLGSEGERVKPRWDSSESTLSCKHLIKFVWTLQNYQGLIMHFFDLTFSSTIIRHTERLLDKYYSNRKYFIFLNAAIAKHNFWSIALPDLPAFLSPGLGGLGIMPVASVVSRHHVGGDWGHWGVIICTESQPDNGSQGLVSWSGLQTD